MKVYKRSARLLTITLIAIWFVCPGVFSQEPANSTLHTFSSLQQSFKSPGKRFGSAPLWVWNKDVDSASIKTMLQQFKDNAFGGVFVHPRAGLITPYLSKEWFSLYQYTVKEAKRLGLDVWIYDENSYPSGFAGGHVPDVMPESYNQGEMLELHKEKKLPADLSSWFICLKNENGKFTDITANAGGEKDKTGDYYLFKKTFYYRSEWYGGFSYVDLMVKGVTEKFIEETMTGYEKALGSEFGKTVPGVFSDEPNIEVQYPGNIRWTPDLFIAFYKKWNYHLEANLPCLFEETGEWKKVRHNYYQVLLQLFIDRWSRPFSAYLAKKNMEWTGHYWEHEWPNINHGPDNMAMYAWPQRPGIDMLFNQFDEKSTNAQFGNIRSVKELASVANQLNKKRTLSETYGGGGWELSFKDMKRLGDWEFALGINTLNQHLSFMTIRGARKYDYPQSFSYHTPWWPYYKYLNKYFARLAMALSSGDQINHTLILEPTTTVWMYYKNDIDNLDTKVKETGNRFQQFITRLERSQVEYDLGSENIIGDHGKTAGNKFIIGSRAYSTVILPPGIENIDRPTFILLKKYAEAGGKIIQFSSLQTIDGSPDKKLDEFYQAKYKGLINYEELTDYVIQQLISRQDCKISQAEDAHGDLYHYRRKMNDGELVFLSNASMENNAAGSIKMNGKEVMLMDLFNGEIYKYPVKQQPHGVTIAFDIPPAGSRLFFISDKNNEGFKKYIADDYKGKTVDAPTSIQRASDNVLTIDFCDVEFGDSELKEQHVFDAADTVFKYYGFKDGNPWNTSVQFRDHTITRDTFSMGTGFTSTYYFNIKEDIDLTVLKAVVESAGLYKVVLNDHEITPVPGKWWLDKNFGVFEIGKYVQQGQNKLSLTAKPMSVHAEIEPVYILGDFGLSSAAKGWDIVKPQSLQYGSWKSQAMPMYGDKVAYTQKLAVDKKRTQHYFVRLGEWKGTVCTINVNKKLAGIIAFPPYSFDITPFLAGGENTIEVVVTGSLKNTLGPHHNKPAPGLVTPWHWRNVKNYPAGKDYDLYDYGLMESFKIIEQGGK